MRFVFGQLVVVRSDGEENRQVGQVVRRVPRLTIVRIRGIRLPDSERFPCARRRIRELFGEEDFAWVSFGFPIRSFRFDTRAARRPKLVGPIVASLAIDRDLVAHLCIYPIRRTGYPVDAERDFSVRVLPSLREWLHAKKSRPATAVVGHESIIVEWTGEEHRCHHLRFL
jgi:hypothetical protein